MAEKRWVLHTGAAQGADQAYAVGALKAGGRVMLHLPWGTYERAWVDEACSRFRNQVRTEEVEKSSQGERAISSVFVFHPAAERVSRGVLLLHARNFNIVVPEHPHPVDFMVAFPGPSGGGTMQGVRIADAFHVPMVRLDQVSGPEARIQIESLSKEGNL